MISTLKFWNIYETHKIFQTAQNIKPKQQHRHYSTTNFSCCQTYKYILLTPVFSTSIPETSRKKINIKFLDYFKNHYDFKCI